MEYLEILFGFLGGLGLFLYGISILSDSMQKAAGNRIKNLLKRFTDKPIKGVFVGFTVTGIVQSSSITTVTVVSLVNSGIMTLAQSIGIIFGAEIGTTVTAQMVSFPIGKFSLPIIALGVFIHFLRKRHNGYAGQILIGFGLLFLGMETMKQGFAPLRESEYLLSLLAEFGKTPALGIIASALFTGIIQSSSATTAIIIAMAQEGVINLRSALPLIMGANIGTCITALLASYGTNVSAKRAAFIHLLFNSLGVLIFLPFITIFGDLVATTSSVAARQIANAHTIFNITNTLLFLPLIPVFLYAANRFIPGKDEEIDGGVKYLDKRYLDMPSIALDNVEKEVKRMAKMSLEMLRDSRKVLLAGDKGPVKNIHKKEVIVDNLLQAIGTYSVRLSQKELSKSDARRLSALAHNITDIERVADHAINIIDSAEKKEDDDVIFSKKAQEELSEMFDNTITIYTSAIEIIETHNTRNVKKVMKLEHIIDKNEKDFENNHIARLKKKECNPAAGIIFTEILHNLERIGDHSVNVVDRVE